MTKPFLPCAHLVETSEKGPIALLIQRKNGSSLCLIDKNSGEITKRSIAKKSYYQKYHGNEVNIDTKIVCGGFKMLVTIKAQETKQYEYNGINGVLKTENGTAILAKD